MVFTRRNTDEIRDEEDREVWRQQFTNQPRRPRGRGQERDRNVKTLFKAPPVSKFKGKREPDDRSSVVSGGSRASQTSSCWSTKSRRDWYDPTYWRHGGLR